MADKSDLTPRDIAALLADPGWAGYPPLLTVGQAAELLQVPRGTVYAWSSAGRLKGCSRRVGKHLRLFRDKLIQHLCEGKLHGDF